MKTQVWIPVSERDMAPGVLIHIEPNKKDSTWKVVAIHPNTMKRVGKPMQATSLEEAYVESAKLRAFYKYKLDIQYQEPRFNTHVRGRGKIKVTSDN